MNNSRNTDTLFKERNETEAARAHEHNIKRNWDSLMSFNKRNPEVRARKEYEAPTVKYEARNITAEREAENLFESEDMRPSVTTMQFDGKEDSELYEDIRRAPKTVNRENKAYKINTKGKLLIAVYALVVVTIFSLIILNSRMLKNLDNTIGNYSSQVTQLSAQYEEIMEELNFTMSDEEIERKAVEMGMEKA